jgi:limonene 1,2-monooxygenase
MEEALDAIMALLRAEPGESVSIKTDWFELRDARLQLRPYSFPHFDIAVAATISPTGPRAAGRHGLGLLSIAATSAAGFDALGLHWGVMEERAAEFGQTVDRRKWRLVGPMHLAETEEQARRDVAFGLEAFGNYFKHILPVSPTGDAETLDDMIDELNNGGFGVIGTPDRAVARIQELVDQSAGGFGTFLLMAHEWADREATRRSYELFSRYVAPAFTGQLAAPAASCDWVTGSGKEFVNRAATAIGKAVADHAAEQAAKSSN